MTAYTQCYKKPWMTQHRNSLTPPHTIICCSADSREESCLRATRAGLVKRKHHNHIEPMSDLPPFPKSEFCVDILEHPETGLLMAVSKDIAGFSLVARSEDEMFEKLDGALKEFIVFSGFEPGEIVATKNQTFGGFVAPGFIVSATGKAAA